MCARALRFNYLSLWTGVPLRDCWSAVTLIILPGRGTRSSSVYFSMPIIFMMITNNLGEGVNKRRVALSSKLIMLNINEHMNYISRE